MIEIINKKMAPPFYDIILKYNKMNEIIGQAVGHESKDSKKIIGLFIKLIYKVHNDHA